jgi:hypothetical protein
VGTLVDAPEQYLRCAQCQSIAPELYQTFLLNADPVGKTSCAPRDV